jgi:hypothetical protein
MSEVALVVFNYDRCIEHYLFNALRTYYRMADGDAASLIAQLEIHHVYGDVSPLPWVEGSDVPAAGFGVDPSARQLLLGSQRLKTFTEGTDPTEPKYRRIRELLETGDNLVFLGFAFHRLNLNLLLAPRTSPIPTNRKRIYASALGMSGSDIEVVSNEIAARTGADTRNVKLEQKLTAGHDGRTA